MTLCSFTFFSHDNQWMNIFLLSSLKTTYCSFKPQHLSYTVDLCGCTWSTLNTVPSLSLMWKAATERFPQLKTKTCFCDCAQKCYCARTEQRTLTGSWMDGDSSPPRSLMFVSVAAAQLSKEKLHTLPLRGSGAARSRSRTVPGQTAAWKSRRRLCAR